MNMSATTAAPAETDAAGRRAGHGGGGWGVRLLVEPAADLAEAGAAAA